MKFNRLTTGLLSLAFLPLLLAQAPEENPVHWTASAPAKAVPAGQVFDVYVKAGIDGDWHLYSTTTPPGGPNPTRFSILPGGPFQLAGAVKQSTPKTEFDQNFGIPTEFYAEGAEFWIPMKAVAGTKPGNYEGKLQVIFQVCNDQMCLPPTRVPIPFQVRLAAGPAVQPIPPSAEPAPAPSAAAKSAQTQGTSAATASLQPPTPPPQAATPAAAAPAKIQEQATQTPAGTAAEVEKARAAGFWPFLWLAMTMGAISLATPCVFPMIPITVSYFTKSAESRQGSGLSQALVYCFGIIFTFSGLGLGLAALLGATGLNQFAANPWINLLITGIFIAFALNLFGLYQIGIPSSVLTRLSSAGSGGGYVQALLMGLTFTLTSFTCTVPFVGTVLVATSQGEWLWPAMGMLAFSVVFALPFFVLALIPRLLTSLPKSGGWLNSVKVTMGFLEVAAAMKFVSNVDLVWNWQFFTREVVLAIWLAISVLAAVYLLGKLRLPHDSPVESIGVARMLWAMLFLALGFHLFTGLIGGSLGELDAFLPPRTAGATTFTGSGPRGHELTWKTDLNAALSQAKQEKKPVFIDFTGYTCTNCRWMEANIFTLPSVQVELDKFVRVQLFTDGDGPQYEQNQRYQKDRFGTVALPFYVILNPEGEKVSTFPGMTRKAEEFLQFLRTPTGPAKG